MLFFVLASLGIWFYIGNTTKEITFQLFDKADFYVVYNDSIKSYRANEKGLEEIHDEKVNVADMDIHPWYSRGAFDSRFLVFSEETRPFTNGKANIVSIDFKKGVIRKNPTDFDAYSGAGYSDDYFYTHQATTEEGSFFSFDEQGNFISSITFDESTSADSQFSGKNGEIYFIASQESSDEEGVYENKLFILSEKPELEIKEEILMDDNPDFIYGFNASVVMGDFLYTQSVMKRDRLTKEKLPDNRFLKFNIKTKEKEWVELSEYFPNLVFKSEDEQKLLIVHEENSLGKSGISIVDTTTNKNQFVDVSQIVGSNDLSLATIYHAYLTKENKLLILTSQNLIYYDLDKMELLDSIENAPEEVYSGIYIWNAKN